MMNCKLISRVVGAVALSAFLFVGCSEKSDDPNKGGGGGGGIGSFKDSRDGKSYKTVKIGTQTWMAKNLDRATANSKCYANSPDSCARYGRLYNWNDALTACPSGWHLPTDAEWTTLTNYVGGANTAGTKLKSKTGWASGGNGTDAYGFSALPGGGGSSYGTFGNAGDYGGWWSAAVYGASYAWDRGMYYYSEGVGRNGYGKAMEFSVRCVQD